MPLVIMIALGFFLRKTGFLPRSFFQSGNKLVFRVLLPCSLFCSIYSVESLSAIHWDVILYVYGATIVILALGWLSAALLVKELPSRGAAIQCCFRSNIALIGLSLATNLAGQEAAAVMSITSGFSVPLFNVLAVTVLSVNREQRVRVDFRGILRDILHNPLILSCLAGLAAVGLRLLLPKGADGSPVFSLQRDLSVIWQVLQSLSGVATPFAMVVLGALLDFSAIGGKLKYILFGTCWRLLLTPAIGIGGAVLLAKLGLISGSPAVYATLIAFFGSPVAVSSAIMAAEMGSDGELARQYVVWTSLGLILTLPLIIVLLRSLGIL